jgi:hypothetical protein
MRGRNGKLVYCQIREIEKTWDAITELDNSGGTVLDIPVQFKSTTDALRNSGVKFTATTPYSIRITLTRK